MKKSELMPYLVAALEKYTTSSDMKHAAEKLLEYLPDSLFDPEPKQISKKDVLSNPEFATYARNMACDWTEARNTDASMGEWVDEWIEKQLAKLSEPEFSFKCEDGVVVTDPNTYVYGVTTDANGQHVWEDFAIGAKNSNPNTITYFSSRELAEASIKPAFELICQDGVCNDPLRGIFYIYWGSVRDPVIDEVSAESCKFKGPYFLSKEKCQPYLDSMFEGYVADKDYFSGKIAKGRLFKKSSDPSIWLPEHSYLWKYGLPAEIVTRWKKVYRKTSN
jgi:hypothetical protein